MVRKKKTVVKNSILALFVIILSIIAMVGLDRYFHSEKGGFFVLEKNQPVSNFRFETIDGQGYELSDFSDKTVIVHFWATWCAPCVVEFPELVKLALKRKDIVVLAFSSDKNKSSIDHFLKTNISDFPKNLMVIQDNDKYITNKKFSVFQLPESFILKPGLRFEDHIVGAYEDWIKIDL